MPKTVVIWDDCQANIRFFVIDKDVCHLNGKYCNSSDISEKENDEICNLVYDTTGREIITFSKDFPYEEVKNGAIVIITGFLP